MKKFIFIAIAILMSSVFLQGCKSRKKTATISPPDMHTSMTALDWQGIYVGMLPCADCEGIRTILELKEDLSFVYQWVYVGKNNDLYEQRGQFKWNDDGNSITLLIAETCTYMPSVFSVGENRIMQHDMEGNRITGEMAHLYVLEKQGLKLESTTWKLTELFGQPIPGNKTLNTEPYLQLSVSENRISGNSSCNQFFATYQLHDDSRISISTIGATKMACPEMDVEAQLFEALEKADSYSLTGDTLTLLRGDKTPLARFVVGD
jgi:copper homeostasis protein (lipoprotein)